MKSIKDYLFCVWLNKATFLGYLLLILVLVPYPFNVNFILKMYLGIIGFALLVFTAFGVITYWVYRRCKKSVKEHGVGNLTDEVDYCNKVAVNAVRRSEIKKR